MTEKQINTAIAAAVLLAIAGFGAYQLSLAYPLNHFRAIQWDRCELVAGWEFRFHEQTRLLCGLNAMDELAKWAAR